MSRKRKTYAQQSVLAYIEKGETYAQAKRRLDAEWQAGSHPSQLEGVRRTTRPAFRRRNEEGEER